MAIKDKKINDDYNIDAVLKETQDKLDRPDKFAEIFCAAAASQVKVKDCLSSIIKEVLSKDKETYGFLKITVREVEKEDVFSFVKKISFLGWTALTTFCGTALGFLLKNLLEKTISK